MAECLIIGYVGDPTIRHVLGVLRPDQFDFLELLEFYREGSAWLDLTSGRLEITSGGQTFDLNDYAAIYQRLLFPARQEPIKEASRREQGLFRALDLALANARGNVINLPYAGWENNLKPLQTHLLRNAGFTVPVSLSSAIPRDASVFCARGPVIYKSNSGERSIVERVREDHCESFELIEAAPVFFQEQIIGDDVRVHSVGDACFGVRIRSLAVDYRYARRQGLESKMQPIASIPDHISELCIEYARSRGIFIAGFDFKLSANGGWYCLEMNPNPGFDSYDRVLGGEIAAALRCALIGA